MTSFTTTLHLRAGTPQERQVRVSATVSLYAGRYRIDRLQTMDGSYIGGADLDEAYDQVIDAARQQAVEDDAREDLRNHPC